VKQNNARKNSTGSTNNSYKPSQSGAGQTQNNSKSKISNPPANLNQGTGATGSVSNRSPKTNPPASQKNNGNQSNGRTQPNTAAPVKNTPPARSNNTIPAGKPTQTTNPQVKQGSNSSNKSAPVMRANQIMQGRNPAVGNNDPTRRNQAGSRAANIPGAIGPNDPTRLDNPARPAKRGNAKVWLLGGLAAVLVLLAAGGTYLYFRTASFVNDTLGAYNAPSLLTATASPVPPTATLVPTATPVQVKQVAGSVPTAVPTATPRPTATPTPDTSPAIVQKIKRGERITALLLGYGGEGHDGANLTDTIMLISYDPAKKAVSLVNIPRDLYVLVPYGGPKYGYWGKINSAFAYIMDNDNVAGLSPRYQYRNDNQRVDAAVNLTKDIVEEVTGVPIDYWALVSFDGFRNLINAIGGVDVNVDTTFDDYEYPANDNPQIDASVKHIHFDAGLQHMDGERAIEYSRSRHSVQDGSDFGRSKRQMKVIQAVKEKAARPDILFKAFSIMDALQGKIRSSLSLDDIRGLADYFRSSDGSAAARDVYFVSQILSSNFLYDSSSYSAGYILLPQAGQGNYKPIQEWIKQGMENPDIRSENLKVQVQNGSGNWKNSTSATDNLETRGFNLLESIWANPVTTTTILDYSDGKGKKSLAALAELFPGVEVKTAVRPVANPEAPDIVVLLGKDYTTLFASATLTPTRGVSPYEVGDASTNLTPSAKPSPAGQVKSR
jgi:LCP family protein required for cell wall assembly